MSLAQVFTSFAKSISTLVGRPSTFILAAAVIVVWAVSGPVFGYSDTWQLIINTGTTIVTFLMVFLIQNTQNRDGAAVQAKLDELLRSLDGARNTFVGIEGLTDSELTEIIERIGREAANGQEDSAFARRLSEMHLAIDRGASSGTETADTPAR
ncbi:low affinity iron permease family protein [Albidovulum sp.]|uniref:low affinity iron permease family protein n=1 Tax=Albidovulum sp. TaxID=1872424 RepID=UPI0039B92F1C